MGVLGPSPLGCWRIWDRWDERERAALKSGLAVGAPLELGLRW